MASPVRPAAGGHDLSALEAIADAVRAGSGLPEVVRAAARALDASLILIDRTGAVLAVAARSPADERALVSDVAGVETVALRVADMEVGSLRMRSRGGDSVDAGLVGLVSTLVASELERVRAPERASEAAAVGFLRDALAPGSGAAPADLLARGRELGIELAGGATVVVARAHPLTPTDEDWRSRVLALADRGARAGASATIAAPAERTDAPGAEVVLLVPESGDDGAAGRRVAELVLGELESGLPGFRFAVGRSRVAADPGDLPRAASEALLAANVAEGDPTRTVLSIEETGTYRVLLAAMMEDPDELGRFYAETLEPLVAYDEQYATELVQTLATYLGSDGSVAATAAKLYTHRHTIRYRLERVRELCGHDVGSTDGRERLSLGLKAMRVLGILAPRGPATERGAAAGRVPREGR